MLGMRTRKHLLSIIDRRFVSYCPKNAKSEVASIIRSAQAVESFRANFYKSSQADINISLNDIDHMINSGKVRPSLLLGVYEGLGYAAGSIVRLSPINRYDISRFVTEVIDDASTQQMNDSIRFLSSQESSSSLDDQFAVNDVKETLKFHRDIRSSADSSTSTASEVDKDSHNSHHSTDSSKNPFLEARNVISLGLYQALKVSEFI